MISLDKDLQKNKKSLEDFFSLSKRVRVYLPNVLSHFEENNGYTLYVSEVAGSKRYLRPINHTLYIQDDALFELAYADFLLTVSKIKARNLEFDTNEKNNINSFLYTIQQSIGAGLDLLVDPNSARKHVGNRFEELIREVFTAIGVMNKTFFGYSNRKFFLLSCDSDSSLADAIREICSISESRSLMILQ